MIWRANAPPSQTEQKRENGDGDSAHGQNYSELLASHKPNRVEPKTTGAASNSRASYAEPQKQCASATPTLPNVAGVVQIMIGALLPPLASQS